MLYIFNISFLSFITLSLGLVTLVIACRIYRKVDELRKDAIDALCCLAHALGEDFTLFIPSIHKLLLKYRLRVMTFPLFLFISCHINVWLTSTIGNIFKKVIYFSSTRNLRKLKGVYKDASHWSLVVLLSRDWTDGFLLRSSVTL